jgi:DNA (cytosine-5)-methyltransferase 1
MKHGSLFSGIGGFDLAATWMGWENIFQCEKDGFCRKVLKYYWPEAVCYEEIKSFDARGYRGVIDVLTGGFPCQPFSVAGPRRGTEDDRYLWPEMLRVIGEVRPRWIVGENVLGLVNWKRGLVFHQVLADLEAAGYQAWPYILPAAGVGAPHQRDRVWIIAYAGGNESQRFGGVGSLGGAAGKSKGPEGEDLRNAAGYRGKENANADADSKGRPRRIQAGIGGIEKAFATSPRRELTRNHGTNDWERFPTQPPVCAGDDGVSARLDGITFSRWRNESIRSAGNAIVPQVAFELFRVIEQVDKMILCDE